MNVAAIEAPAQPAGARRAALFDMDRTLLRKETASLYVRFWVAQYTLGVLDIERVAPKLLAEVRGLPETVLAARCDDWFARYVERYITDGGREAVRRHREAGELCAIVTGASPYAAWPLARRLRIDHVVSTVFEMDAERRFTGRPELPFCLGAGKVERAERLARQHGFRLEDAAFYTDSVSDLPLMERVAEPIAVNPDPRLRRIAERRGWRIERW
jgi:HAD superfamily phosphoserine phosphatase-like hydrolase